jgi:uncharacterized membrane protein YphA (DoxX/SURF4 family)
MSTVIGLLSVLLTLAFLGAGGAKVVGNRGITRSVGQLGVTPGMTKTIGALELAAAAGLIVGFWIKPVAFAASFGLVLLMVGAVAYHVRAREGLKQTTPPLALGVLSVANAVLIALA